MSSELGIAGIIAPGRAGTTIFGGTVGMGWCSTRASRCGAHAAGGNYDAAKEAKKAGSDFALT
jgi:hypothetical protein